MDIKNIPVRVIGPGSQPGIDEDENLEYMHMPSDMAKYTPPLMPDPEEVQHLDGAREAMDWLRASLADYQPGSKPMVADLSALNDECRALVNQILGEGEVSITCDGSGTARTQESVLAGVWRTLYLDANDKVICDLLEVADVPHVFEQCKQAGQPINTSSDGVADTLSNALPILVELEASCDRYNSLGNTHTINMTLLPLSDEELEFLDQRLGRGPIDILSRAYGRCQIISTGTRDVWWVRHYNSMGILILNLLEVVSVPEIVGAAAEDLADSAQRLNDILAPYWSEVA
ncbi:MAG: hydrogenase expression/formation C-terminal domain-containing protein [Woeseiaceae bacterium]